MKCLFRNNKKSVNIIRWVTTELNDFKIKDISFIFKNKEWKHIIFNNSPFYFIYDTTLDELIKKVDDSHTSYLMSLSKNKYVMNKIEVTSLIHNTDDIADRLKTGQILKVVWIGKVIEYTIYY
jgi:hypothetical protein